MKKNICIAALLQSHEIWAREKYKLTKQQKGTSWVINEISLGLTTIPLGNEAWMAGIGEVVMALTLDPP